MPVSNKITPYWRSICGRAIVYVGDCREVLAKMEPEQFHAVVTDPPYGLEFMNLEFDAPWKYQKISSDAKIETCDEGTDKSHPFRDGTQRVNYGNKRVHKVSGGVDAKNRRADEMNDPVKAKYLHHNVEYIRDSHLYQEWFQSCAEAILRVTKPGAHLLSFGGTRMWHRMVCAVEDAGWNIRETIGWVYFNGFPKSHDISKAIDKMHGMERTAVGRSDSGLGAGQFTKNAGVDSGYGYSQEYDVTVPATDDAKRWSGWGTSLKPAYEPVVVARKPMNSSVAQNTLEHGCGGLNIDACRIGDGEYRQSMTGGMGRKANPIYGQFANSNTEVVSTTQGRWPSNIIIDGSEEVLSALPEGATRLFYSAKADHSDRPHGKGETTHPTCKPLSLMQYLVRLVCPRGGTVLDPFMGSGSTGVATLTEGMNFVGIEQSQEYADIAVGRLKLALESAPPMVELKTRKAVNMDKDVPPPPKKLRLK